MSTPAPPEAWLRGPITGVPALLQPAAHALVQAREEVARTCSALTAAQLLARPAGAPSILFHLHHLAGSTERLLTYARGESLTDEQRKALKEEGQPESEPDLAALLAHLDNTIDRALNQLRETPEATLHSARTVGRQQLPATVFGLLMHAAEHASRHVGQIVTTARIVTHG